MALEVASGADQSADYLAGFSQVDHFALDVVDVAIEAEFTTVTLRYDLRAVRADGGRQHDRGTIELDVVLGEDVEVTGMRAVELERLSATRAPAYTDVTDSFGDPRHRKEAIRRGGYALVAADYNNDDLPDLLVGNYGPLKLYRNTGAGWVDATAEAGIQNEGVVKSAGMADMDGDGDRDLLLLRFVIGQQDHMGDFIAYENLGDGTFKRLGEVLPKARK